MEQNDPPHGDPFLNLEHARSDEQRKLMERIQTAKICPFCPENADVGELMPILKSGSHWTIRENRWPYRWTTHHLLAIPNEHVERLSELSEAAMLDLFRLLRWMENEYGSAGNAVGVRSGNTTLTGATVAHLHVHFVVASTETEHPEYERVRFPMGPKQTALKKQTPHS